MAFCRLPPSARPGRAHRLDVLHEAERPRARHFLHVRMLGEIDDDVAVLGPEHRMRKIDREVQLEAVERVEARPLVAVAHLDRRAHAQVALRRRLLDDARRLQQEHERTGAAVHDRQLGTGDVDVQVVDAHAGKRGHQVLDGRDRRAVPARASTKAACRRRWSPARGSSPASAGRRDGTRCRCRRVPGAASIRRARRYAARRRSCESNPSAFAAAAWCWTQGERGGRRAGSRARMRLNILASRDSDRPPRREQRARRAASSDDGTGIRAHRQSACLRRNAGISDGSNAGAAICPV